MLLCLLHTSRSCSIFPTIHSIVVLLLLLLLSSGCIELLLVGGLLLLIIATAILWSLVVWLLLDATNNQAATLWILYHWVVVDVTQSFSLPLQTLLFHHLIVLKLMVHRCCGLLLRYSSLIVILVVLILWRYSHSTHLLRVPTHIKLVDHWSTPVIRRVSADHRASLTERWWHATSACLVPTWHSASRLVLLLE